MKYKIVITGPVGSGKTTAINSLTNDDAFITDVLVSDSDEVTKQRKSNTTVAMDFGVVQVKGDTAYIYGTPGQQRFSFMWDILSKGAHGIIILLDNTRNYPFRDLKYYVDSFSDLIASNKLIIGVTRSDEDEGVSLSVYQNWLVELNLDAEVQFIDAREKDNVEGLVRALVESIKEPAIDKRVMTSSAVVANEQSEHVDEAIDNKILEGAPTEKALVETIPDAVAEVQKISPDEVLDLNEASLEQVATLKGVNGVTLTNSIGELLHSTINDDDINEFIAFLSGIAPALEDASNMGSIHRIMLRGPQDENLTVFVEEERSLGVSSDKAVSVPALSQKIEDMLQWV